MGILLAIAELALTSRSISRMFRLFGIYGLCAIAWLTWAAFFW